ncbi:hypothetical protein GIS00_04070 [Nakamurella sp. YIM 132087]|uniref:Uncharacterized protein n=2 Tax=Nakamurella alba TaxID=2665158 RepID=A0A7K1FG86_9ACTN|nr:hypothetical protein [Nakamurella alba]
MEPEAAAWQWILADGAGVVIGPAPVAFTDQTGAERWLSEHFDELQADGVETVSLMDGERPVYGPMFLAPDAPGPEEATSAL